MADFPLYHFRQFAERQIKSVRNENWVVPETAHAARFMCDPPFAYSLGREQYLAL